MPEAESFEPELDQFFWKSVDLLAVLRDGQRIGFTNSAWQTMLGWDKGTLETIGYMDLVHPDDVERTLRESDQMFNDTTDVRVGFENRLRCRDGSYRRIEWTSRRQGGLIYTVGRDVTLRHASVARLDEALAMTKAIFDAAADSIVVIDRELRIAATSPVGQRIFGWPDDLRVRGLVLEIVDDADRPVVEAALVRMFEVDEVIEVRFRAHHFDGHSMTVETRGRALRNPDGPPEFAVVITRDVSKSVAEGAALAEGLRKITAIVNTAVDTIITIDRDFNIMDVSPVGERVLGVSAKERQGRSALERVNPDDVRIAEDALHRMFDAGEIVTARYRLRHGDGSWLTVESRGRAIDNGGEPPTSAVIVTRDITESVAMQRALEGAKEEAERANEAKSQFLSRMSHELRTPLNSVLGFAQILQMELDSDDAIEIVDNIYTSGRHLLNLINEMLDITRVESGQVRILLETVALEGIVAESVSLVSPLANDRGVSITYDDGCGLFVYADRQRCKQVIVNLLANAVKYNRPDGTVALCCDAGDGRVRVSIIDTGIGIAPDLVARLFIPFDRLNAESLGVEGTGLGLALSKNLTEAMGGTLGVTSVVGEGSTFWLELPEADAATMVRAATGSGRHPSARPHRA